MKIRGRKIIEYAKEAENFEMSFIYFSDTLGICFDLSSEKMEVQYYNDDFEITRRTYTIPDYLMSYFLLRSK